MRSALKLMFGGSCQTNGPRREPSAMTPDPKKKASAASTSFKRLMWVMP